jgi:hypothetical protein
VLSLWWLYLDQPASGLALDPGHRPTRSAKGGYGHHFIFAAAAAVDSSPAVAVDQFTGRSELNDRLDGPGRHGARTDLHTLRVGLLRPVDPEARAR